MTTTIRVTAIDFDTDGDKKLAKSLADETTGNLYEVEHDDDQDPFDLLADVISDGTGWCVNSVSGEIVA